LDYFGKPFSSTARSIGAMEVEGSSGAFQPLLHKIKLFPNPVQDFLFLDTEASRVQIFNYLGVLEMEIEGSAMISVSHLQPGMYVVKTDGETGRFLKH
jgi:hypothetical protein